MGSRHTHSQTLSLRNKIVVKYTERDEQNIVTLAFRHLQRETVYRSATYNSVLVEQRQSVTTF